ncbi:hypothetical protein [Pseudogemmobacter sp. W21_MBD1_M6]|uniref:hypothetical protein n=1 Tax=Pseudogemmobacter sp. W21_MBD1_M6 TaxID=3240271 RepID=UPI003F9A4D28
MCVGFFELGNAYAKSADFLSNAASLETFKIPRDEPIDFLYAHAFELMLKGCLIAVDPTEDVERFRHNLECLYDTLKSRNSLEGLIINVELAIKERWKQHLQGARDRFKARLDLGVLSTGESEDFGILGNDVIGEQLPDLRRQVVWLSNRHKNGGGHFRYSKCGWDNTEYIKDFGLSDNVVWKSSHWACEEIYDRFRKHCSSKSDQS